MPQLTVVVGVLLPKLIQVHFEEYYFTIQLFCNMHVGLCITCTPHAGIMNSDKRCQENYSKGEWYWLTLMDKHTGHITRIEIVILPVSFFLSKLMNKGETNMNARYFVAACCPESHFVAAVSISHLDRNALCSISQS